ASTLQQTHHGPALILSLSPRPRARDSPPPRDAALCAPPPRLPRRAFRGIPLRRRVRCEPARPFDHNKILQDALTLLARCRVRCLRSRPWSAMHPEVEAQLRAVTFIY